MEEVVSLHDKQQYTENARIVYPVKRRRDQFAINETGHGRFVGKNYTQWTGDGKKATNGSNDPSPTRPLLNGFPYEYKCDTDYAGTKSVQLIYDYEVMFQGDASEDVEFWRKDLFALEWGLLYIVADTVGLRNCNFTKQDNLDFPGRRGRLLDSEEAGVDESLVATSTTTEEEDVATTTTVAPAAAVVSTANDRYVKPRIVSLTSTRQDSPNLNARGCERLVDVPTGSTCIPMQGFMRATYENDGREAVESYLLGIIEREMNDQQILVGDIVQTEYIGRQMITASGVRNDASSSTDSNMEIAAGVTIPVAFIVLVVAVLLFRRKKSDSSVKHSAPVETDLENMHSESGNSRDYGERRNSPTIIDEVASTTNGDGELGNNTYYDDDDDVEKQRRSSNNNNNSRSNRDDDHYVITTVSTTLSDGTDDLSETALAPNDEDNDDYYDNSSRMAVRDTAADDVTELHCNIPDNSATATAAPKVLLDTVAGTTVSKQVVPNAQAQALMTLPALTRPVSEAGDERETVISEAKRGLHRSSTPPRQGARLQTLKRRRKKKKIKKPKLIRRNSREQVTEMEAINEAEEGEDESCSGSDSEYSWATDDDVGSHTGGRSRDPSPIPSSSSRSLTSVPSRDSSPIPPIHSRTLSQGDEAPLPPRVPSDTRKDTSASTVTTTHPRPAYV